MHVLLGATLIDGTGAAPVADAAVVIQDGRIRAVGPRHAVSWPADAEVTDLTGLTILPGLIDGHDHLAAHGYALTQRWGLHEPLSTAHMRTATVLRQTLETGYTTIRDAAGLDVGFKMAVVEGLIPGPRLHLAVNIISPTGGLGDRVSPSGHDCCVVLDPTLPSGVANGIHEVQQVVRAMVRAGADVIKCATTGGASSRAGHGPKDIAFNKDEMRALVDESHALGRRVMCHALGGAGLRMAIEAGVDSIEHGCYLDEDPELIAMMAERGIFFVPTLTVYVFHRERSAPHVQARGRELYPHHIASIQQALAAGVKIVAGTDAGGHEHNINARELHYLVEAGLTPMQALQSATGWAAECLGLAPELGTITPGKQADIIAVDGNPLHDIKLLQDIERIKLVLKGGTCCVDRRIERPVLA
ncbi:MAG: amidohydrolase family protein [Candidatus Tectomicrobia bacterium]|uniref:Amidohydrolase family protein n=1 Tax=Tectimicrobiota bacterium TaxID=2528274 RepID=A0A938B2N1_UNCTE|nr:amidohydrolase family protein [Candidatus Tectomicrobia bacterium]